MPVELRRFLRVATDYRVEYGPFPLLGEAGELKTSVIKNIGGGGLMFPAPEPIEVGRQLVVRIYLTGWRRDGDDVVESSDPNDEAPVTAMAEVTRLDRFPDEERWAVAVKFLGRILG